MKCVEKFDFINVVLYVRMNLKNKYIYTSNVNEVYFKVKSSDEQYKLQLEHDDESITVELYNLDNRTADRKYGDAIYSNRISSKGYNTSEAMINDVMSIINSQILKYSFKLDSYEEYSEDVNSKRKAYTDNFKVIVPYAKSDKYKLLFVKSYDKLGNYYDGSECIDDFSCFKEVGVSARTKNELVALAEEILNN